MACRSGRNDLRIIEFSLIDVSVGKSKVHLNHNPLTMRKLTLLIGLYAILFSVQAQKEHAIWHIADKKIDFNFSPPQITTLPADEQVRYVSWVLCDGQGQRSMYFGKGYVFYNHLKQPISDPFGTVVSGIQLIPSPSHCGQWYVFGNNRVSLLDTVTHSLVTLPSMPQSATGIVIRHPTMDAWWYVIGVGQSIYAYLIDANGISPSPVVSTIATGNERVQYVQVDNSLRYFIASAIVESATMPDFKGHNYTGTFDVQTGSFGVLHTYDSVLACNFCFSPDGTKVYASGYGFVAYTIRNNFFYQYEWGSDANLGDPILLEQTTPAVFVLMVHRMQIAPDGKLYRNKDLYANVIDIVHNPNELGVACNFQPEAIRLSLPASVPYYPQASIASFPCKLSLVVSNFCHTEVTQFSIENGQSIQSYLWNFGDGHTSTEAETSHIYEKSGKYSVSLEILKSDNSTENISKEIEIIEKPLKPVIVKSSD
jgi:hypothetical protein